MDSALLRGLLDGADSGAALLDAEGRLLYANRFLSHLLRRPKASLVGLPFERCLASGQREGFRGFLRQGAPRDAEFLLSARSAVVPCLLRLESAGPDAVALFVQDLRLLRKYEGAVMESQVTRAILTEIAEAVVLLNARGVIVKASASAWRLAGRNPIARPFDEMFPLRVLDAKEPRPPLSALLARPEGFRGGATLATPHGEPRHLALSARPVALRAGMESGAVVVMTDITDAKHLELELRRTNETLQRRVEERTARLLLLYDLARISNEAESQEQALSLALERMCRGGEWKFAQGFLLGAPPRRPFLFQTAWPPEELGDRGLSARLDPTRRQTPKAPLFKVVESGHLEWTSNLRALGERGRAAARAGFRAVAAVPLRRGPEVLGALELFSSEAQPPGEDARTVLVAAGLQLGEAIDRKRLQREFAEAVSQEHETIGRELHDSVGQELTGLALMLRSLPDARREGVTDEVTRGLQRVLREVHDLSRGVFPAELRNLGLSGGLARLAQQTSKRSGFRVRFDDEAGPLPLDAQTCLQVFRVAQEAVNNAVKYSGGSEVRLRLTRKGEVVELDVQDDGRGLPSKRDNLRGSGLRIMRFRAEAIGGALRLRHGSKGGARVTCRWKISGADAPKPNP